MADLRLNPWKVKKGDTVWVRATVIHDMGDGAMVEIVGYGNTPGPTLDFHCMDIVQRGEVAGDMDDEESENA